MYNDGDIPPCPDIECKVIGGPGSGLVYLAPGLLTISMTGDKLL